jgi:hypothetical protein
LLSLSLLLENHAIQPGLLVRFKSGVTGWSESQTAQQNDKGLNGHTGPVYCGSLQIVQWDFFGPLFVRSGLGDDGERLSYDPKQAPPDAPLFAL